MNYTNEGGTTTGLELRKDFHTSFNLHTNADSLTTIFGITSSDPDFRLSNGIYPGMIVSDLLKLDSNVVFNHEMGDMGPHFQGEGYYAVIVDIGMNVDRTVEFGKELNSQVKPTGKVYSIGIWENRCE